MTSTLDRRDLMRRTTLTVVGVALGGLAVAATPTAASARPRLPWQTLSASLEANTVVLFEHRSFALNGRIRRINVTAFQPQQVFSLHVMDFKDCLSSLRWNLDPGVVVTLFEDHSGGGRQYPIWGAGEDKDTHDNNFKDCASSWTWHRSS